MNSTNKKFLDPEQVLFRAGLNRSAMVADLGAGSGFFAMAAAKIVGDEGKIFVVDILESSLTHISSEARIRQLRNIQTIRHDLEKPPVKLIPDGAIDLVVLANVLHQTANHQALLSECYRMLKTQGKLLIIDWNQTVGAVGPKHGARVAENIILDLTKKLNLKPQGTIETDNYHFGLLFTK
jgi:ubiquinone/menaquinone biosynthesis C-methylase UbiE